MASAQKPTVPSAPTRAETTVSNDVATHSALPSSSARADLNEVRPASLGQPSATDLQEEASTGHDSLAQEQKTQATLAEEQYWWDRFAPIREFIAQDDALLAAAKIPRVVVIDGKRYVQWVR